VVDLMPGSGYFTRIFSKIVGPKGAVYAYQPSEVDHFGPKALKPMQDLVADPAYGNVKLQHEPIAAFSAPEAVDLVWTSQNYHDLHDPWMGSPDVAKFDKAVFNALKPGGIFLVLDHVATDGSGLGATNTLHRIDPATVKAEVTSAGFEFVGESKVLRNSADDHTLKVFDPAIRGKTDQFIYKFRKPAH
jgi:predicted methyltransferase